jgi:hypothetical protein
MTNSHGQHRHSSGIILRSVLFHYCAEKFLILYEVMYNIYMVKYITYINSKQ